MDDTDLSRRIRELVRGELERDLKTETGATGAPRVSQAAPPPVKDPILARKVAAWVGASFPTPPWAGTWRPAGPRESYLESTPARLAVGRVSTRYRTPTILSFWTDHAAARDAVASDISAEIVSGLSLAHLHSSAVDKAEFLRRPDLGRKLSGESRTVVEQRGMRSPQVQIVAADGLSAAAINANLPLVLPVLTEELRHNGVRVGTVFAISNSRVACGDEVARLLDADVLCLLVGERPGLKTAESMGAYVTYMKVKNFNEAMRSVISNIHGGGLKPEEGARAVARLCLKALADKRTGVDMSS